MVEIKLGLRRTIVFFNLNNDVYSFAKATSLIKEPMIITLNNLCQSQIYQYKCIRNCRFLKYPRWKNLYEFVIGIFKENSIENVSISDVLTVLMTILKRIFAQNRFLRKNAYFLNAASSKRMNHSILLYAYMYSVNS